MTTYVIYRNGSNAANQHLRQRKPVLIKQASSAVEAVRWAKEQGICYANQTLDAVPQSRVSKRDWNEAANSLESL